MFPDITLKYRNNDFFYTKLRSFDDTKNSMNNSLDITQCQCKNTPCILVHGAAENANDSLIVEKIISCKKAASTGYRSLLSGASSVEAVEAALWWLECDEFFNCGYGSLLNEMGDIQMDACIIDGFKSVCGSVAAVSDIEHPISLARYVLDNFPNSIVVGEGAKKLAKHAKLNWLSKGNMIAPVAHLAYKLGEMDSCDLNWDVEDRQHVKLLKSNRRYNILQSRGLHVPSNYGAIRDEGISDMKLFNFREWQRYIECRKTVIINSHFPTRLKYNSNIPDCNSLYIKFLEWANSKADRDEPEITTHKHLIPRDLVHAMKQCITNVHHIDLPLNEVNIFAPTLTPYYSYLQQLLEHPLQDIPSILRNGFFSTKIGYTTKLEYIYQLALQYDINLDIIDSNLHFIEKFSPLFEQTKLDSVKNLKGNIAVQDSLETRCNERKENFIDYLHRKVPCQFKIDIKKKQYYDDIQDMKATVKFPLASSDEFIFNDSLSNGKLAIPSRDDNEDSEDDNMHSKDIFSKEMRLSLSKFCKVYNINLSNPEKRAMSKNSNCKKKHKRQPLRNAQGKFVKQTDTFPDIANPEENDFYIEQSKMNLTEDLEIQSILPEISDILNSSDESIFSNLVKKSEYSDESVNYSGIFKLPIDKSSRILDKTNNINLFRPFKDYWMYHCNFGRVKPKNFELFEKMLPRSFRWLLNECASIIEMTTEDLYEEVCLVEAYYANVSDQSEVYESNENAENRNDQAKTNINAILNKW